MQQIHSKIDILRKTAARLAGSEHYVWGHMGSCNCGHLAQEVTELSKAEIHAYAMQRYGDWSTQVREYCPSSGLPIDWIIEQLLAAGFTTRELHELEYLENDQVLKFLPGGKRWLARNKREDVVAYLQAWADMLAAEQLVAQWVSPQAVLSLH
ncbi:MAG: hypothetical protein ACK417_11735 [Bacteroidia bacterium]